jgi:hypothetical protein
VATPTIQRGTVTLAPSPVQAKWLVPTPTITTVSGQVVTPTAVLARFVVATPTLIKGVRTLTASPVVARFVIGAPTLLTGGVTLSLQTAVARWLIPAPTAGTTSPLSLFLQVEDRSRARYELAADVSQARFQLIDASAVRLGVHEHA